jgi:hypothetical protein
MEFVALHRRMVANHSPGAGIFRRQQSGIQKPGSFSRGGYLYLPRAQTARPRGTTQAGAYYAKKSVAGVAELVDAPDSKSGMGNHVRVRFSLPAPFFNSESLLAFDFINVSRNIVEGGR